MNQLAALGVAVGLVALVVAGTSGSGRHPGRQGGVGGGPGRVATGRTAVDRPARRARRSRPGRATTPGRWSPSGGARHDSAHWAGRTDLRPLAVRSVGDLAEGPPPGRLVLGWVGRRLVAAERAQSVIVFGPTQSRKTTGFAVPAILGWTGPVLATSVKTDLIADTLAHRRSCGEVWCFDPSGVTGIPSATWSPLPASRTWPGARRAASALTDVGKGSVGGMADGDFWYAAATKMLAPLLFAAATGTRSMADVIRWVDTQEESEVFDLLEVAGVPEAINAARSMFGKEDRQRSSILTTLETLLEPFAEDPAGMWTAGPAEGPGRVRGDGPVGSSVLPIAVEPERLLAGQNTLFLCAPAHDQRRLSPLFTAVVRQVVEHVYDSVTRTGRPLDPPLLVVLDEAANIAPLSDLDALASTAAGHGIQLVTVWHDLAQITARFGPRAATVVNNHRAKVFLSGISDPSTLDHASALIGDEELLVPAFTSGGTGGRSTTRSPTTRRLVPPDAVRRIPPGEGILVYGGLPPARLRLRTWYDDPVLAARAGALPSPGHGRSDRRQGTRSTRPKARRSSM